MPTKEVLQQVELKVKKYEFPPNTCPLVDQTIKDLEKVRNANEELRSAAYNYYKDNKDLAEENKKLKELNTKLTQQADDLRITREWIKSYTGRSTKQFNFIQLRLERDQLQAQITNIDSVTDMIFDVYESTCKVLNKYKIDRVLQPETREWLNFQSKERKKQQLEIKKLAIAKLSLEERVALGIKQPVIDEEDDEEESE